MFLEYFPLLLIAFLGIMLALILAMLAYFLGPKMTNKVKSLPFESGLEATGTNKIKLHIKFYVLAMIFLVFDIEVIFLYPYAVNFRALGWEGFIAILFFITVLTVGIAYEWKKGATKWD